MEKKQSPYYPRNLLQHFTIYYNHPNSLKQLLPNEIPYNLRDSIPVSFESLSLTPSAHFGRPCSWFGFIFEGCDLLK